MQAFNRRRAAAFNNKYCLVTGADPLCTVDSNSAAVKEFEYTGMRCSVNYRGNWVPVMTWQQNGRPISTLVVANNTDDNDVVSSSLTVLATRNLTGSTFSCTTYFSAAKPPQSFYVTPVPDYQFKWTSPAAEVKCKQTRNTLL